MVIWVYILALTVAGVLVAFWPLLRHKAGELESDFAHDLQVYRDQLQELDRDLANGVISGDAAAQARAEIARRLLAAEDRAARAAKGQGAASRASNAFILAAIAVVAVPVLSAILYLGFGSPTLEAQPLAARLNEIRETERASIEVPQQMRDLVARAEAHLAENPEDGRGWDVLAPVYYRMGEDEKSETAYRNAIRILGETPARLSGLAEVLVSKAGGVVTGEPVALFQRALDGDSNDLRSRYFIALAEAQGGRTEVARDMWQSMAANEAADPAWRNLAGQALARLNGEPDQTRPPALDSQTMQDAAGMSEEDRGAMIAGMVAQLEQRLSSEGGTPDEWKRLVRAFAVMGRSDEAAGALGRAVAAFEDNQSARDDLVSFGREMGISPASQ